MAYRQPGVYAKFIKTASQAVNAGASRIMALVGTGISAYTVQNETVVKRSDRAYDTLLHEDIYDIISVSSLPVYSTKNNPENVYYKPIEKDSSGAYVSGDYELKEGKYIVWHTDGNFTQPTLVNVDTDPYANEGCREFYNNCLRDGHTPAHVDANNAHFVIDGNWRIEVTFANETDGCYRVIKVDTNESVGEYVVSDSYNTTAIPGVNLYVPSTYKYDPETGENAIAAGDYFILRTVANKTETEASVSITASSTPRLAACIRQAVIINSARVVDGTYRIVIKDVSSDGSIVQFQVVEVAGDATETIIYPDATDSTHYATWIKNDEIYDIIPGVEIILDDLTITPNINDGITIVTQARKVTDGIPGEGDSYYISYRYRKPAEGYEPLYFSDYDDIVAEYGNYEVSASGIVINSLALGAEIAFTNGIQQIICVQAKGDTDAEFCDAIDRLKKVLPGVDNVNTIVPLTNSAVVGTYCANHVTTMSSYDYSKERMCYLGAYPNQKMSKAPTGSDRSLGIIETCEGYFNERVVYVVPGRVIKSIRDYNTGKSNDRPLPGCYLAVAVAALGLGSDPAEPITNKAIAGFSYLPEMYNIAEMNLMANKGACIVMMRGNNLIVRHAVTTDPSDVNTIEITCIQIKDYVIEAVRSGCQQYIGQKNTLAAVGNVEYTISNILSQFVNRVIIEAFQNLKVARSTDDPREIKVSFEILPIYSINYISIEFAFMQTG